MVLCQCPECGWHWELGLLGPKPALCSCYLLRGQMCLSFGWASWKMSLPPAAPLGLSTRQGPSQPTLPECSRRPAQNPEIRERLAWNPKIRRRPAQNPEIRVGPLWSLALTFPASHISHHWLRCPDESAAPKGQLARPQAPINCPLAPGTRCLPLSGEAERNLMSLGLTSSLAP